MYGKHITLSDGYQSITIFVYGVPNMPKIEWVKRAKEIINNMK